MPAKDLIDEIRHAAEANGVTMPMSKGRDRISRLLYGIAYSPAIAAERMGKLARPSINAGEVESLSADLGPERSKIIVESATAIIRPATQA